MSGLEEKHYEILGQRGSVWSILEVQRDRTVALQHAERYWTSQTYSGVRVTLETYRLDDHSFTSVEIFSRGRTKKLRGAAEMASVTPCIAPEELYGAAGRRSIWQLMHSRLIEWTLTPTELLHNMDHYLRLYNAGTLLQNAVQRTAVGFDDKGQSIQEKMRRIYTLIDGCVDRLKTRSKKLAPLEAGRLAPLVKLYEHESDKSFLLMVSVCAYLAPAVTMADKFGRVVVLVKPDHAPWVLEVFDQLMAEFLMHPRLLIQLMDEPSQRQSVIYSLIDLICNTDTGRGLVAKNDLKYFKDHLRAGRLEQCRRSLARRLIDEIDNSGALTQNRDIREQLLMLEEIRVYIASADLDSGLRDQIYSAINIRSARLLSPQSIDDLVHDIPDPFDKLAYLLDLDGMAVGENTQRIIAAQMLRVLSQPIYEPYFTGRKQAPFECLQLLALTESRINTSSVHAVQKEKLNQYLDDYATTILAQTKFLQRLDQSDMPLEDKLIRLLGMCADRHITQGHATAKVLQAVQRYLGLLGYRETPSGTPKSGVYLTGHILSHIQALLEKARLTPKGLQKDAPKTASVAGTPLGSSAEPHVSHVTIAPEAQNTDTPDAAQKPAGRSAKSKTTPSAIPSETYDLPQEDLDALFAEWDKDD